MIGCLVTVPPTADWLHHIPIHQSQKSTNPKIPPIAKFRVSPIGCTTSQSTNHKIPSAIVGLMAHQQHTITFLNGVLDTDRWSSVDTKFKCNCGKWKFK